jgi:hypothetical protein
MDFLDVALDIAKDHSSNWKKNFGKDGHTEFLDVFTEAFGGYKKKIDEYFDGPGAAGRTDVRRK